VCEGRGLERHGEINGRLQAKVDEANRLVGHCLTSLHDAMFEFTVQRRRDLVEQSGISLSSLEELVAEEPRISMNSDDLEQVKRHLEWLKDEDFFASQVRIKRDLGSVEFERLRAEEFRRNDHLGRAAEIRAEAVAFEIAGKADEVWRCYEREKHEFLLHAQKHGFTREQTLALVGSVFCKSADFLRKEGKHTEALRHYLYFLTHSGGKSAAHLKRLPAFLSRAGVKKADFASAIECIKTGCDRDDFDVIDRYLSIVLPAS
jgi:hypothetical protein